MANTFVATGTYSNLTRLQLEQLRKADFFAGGKGLTVGDSALPPEGIVGPGDINAEPFLTGQSILLDDVYTLTPPTQPGESLLTITETEDLQSETVKWYGPSHVFDGPAGTVTTGGTTAILTDLSQTFSGHVLIDDLVLFKTGSGGGGQNQFAVASVTTVSAHTLALVAINNSFTGNGTSLIVTGSDGNKTYDYVVVRPNAVQLFAVPASGATGFEQTFMAVVPGSSLHSNVAPTIDQINAARIKNLVPPQYSLNTSVDRADAVYYSPGPNLTLDKLGYRIVLYPDNGSGTAPNLHTPIATLSPVIDPAIPSNDQRMTIDFKAGIIRFSCAPKIGGQINVGGVNPTTGRLSLYAVFWAVDQSLTQGSARGLWATRSTSDVAYPPAKIYWDPTNIAWRFGSTELTNPGYLRAVGAQDDTTGITEFGAIDPAGIRLQRRYIGYRPASPTRFSTSTGLWVYNTHDLPGGSTIDQPENIERPIGEALTFTVGDISGPTQTSGDFRPTTTFAATGAQGARNTDGALSSTFMNAPYNPGLFGTIHLRRGRYILSNTSSGGGAAPLVVPPGIIIEGEGPATVIDARIYTDAYGGHGAGNYTRGVTTPALKFGPNNPLGTFDASWDGSNINPTELPSPQFPSPFPSTIIEGYDIVWNPVRRVWGVAYADATANTIMFTEVAPDGTTTFLFDLKNSATNLYTRNSPNASNHTSGHYPRLAYHEFTDQYAVVWCEEFTHAAVIGSTIKLEVFQVNVAGVTPTITTIGIHQVQSTDVNQVYSDHPSVAIDNAVPSGTSTYALTVSYWGYDNLLVHAGICRAYYTIPSFSVSMLVSTAANVIVPSTDVASDDGGGFMIVFSTRLPAVSGTQGVINQTFAGGPFSYLTDTSVANWQNVGVGIGSRLMYLGVNPTTIPANAVYDPTANLINGTTYGDQYSTDSYGTDCTIYDVTTFVNQARIKRDIDGWPPSRASGWKLVTSSNGNIASGFNTLTDGTVDFVASNVQPGDTITGVDSGFKTHVVLGVSTHQLTITDTWATTQAGTFTYHVYHTPVFNYKIVPASVIQSIRYVASSEFTGELIGHIVVGANPSGTNYISAMREPDHVRLSRGQGDTWLLVYQSWHTTSLFSTPFQGNFDDNINTGYIDQTIYLRNEDYQAPWRIHVSTCADLLNDVGQAIYPTSQPDANFSFLGTSADIAPRLNRDIEISNRSLGTRPPINLHPNDIRGVPTFSNAIGRTLNYDLQVSALNFCHRWGTSPPTLIPDVTWTGSDWAVVSPSKATIHGFTGNYIVLGAAAGQTYLGDPMFYFGTGSQDPITGNFLIQTVSIGDSIYFPSAAVTATISAIHSEHIVELTQADGSLLNLGTGRYPNKEWYLIRNTSSVGNGGIKNPGFRVSHDGRQVLSTSFVTFTPALTDDGTIDFADDLYLMRRASTDVMFRAFNFNEDGYNLPGSIYSDRLVPNSRYASNIRYRGVAVGDSKGCNELGLWPTVAIAWGETLYGMVDQVIAGDSANRENHVAVYRQSFGPYYNGLKNLSIRCNAHSAFGTSGNLSPLKVLSRSRVFTRHGMPTAAGGFFATDGYRNCFGHTLLFAHQEANSLTTAYNYERIVATYTDATGRNPILVYGPNPIVFKGGFVNDTTTDSSIWNATYAPNLSFESVMPTWGSSPRVLWDGSRFVVTWADNSNPTPVGGAPLLNLAIFPGDEDNGPQGPEMVTPGEIGSGPFILQSSLIDPTPGPPGPGPMTTMFFTALDVAFSGEKYAVIWSAGLNPFMIQNGTLLGVTIFDGVGMGGLGTAMGLPKDQGNTGSSTGTNTFTDLSASFHTAVGDILVINNGPAAGRYIIATIVNGATSFNISSQNIPAGSNYKYSIHPAIQYPPGGRSYVLAAATVTNMTGGDSASFFTPKIVWDGRHFVAVVANHQYGFSFASGVSTHGRANVLMTFEIPQEGMAAPIAIKRVGGPGIMTNGRTNIGLGTMIDTTSLNLSATLNNNTAGVGPSPLVQVGDILIVTSTTNASPTADNGWYPIIQIGWGVGPSEDTGFLSVKTDHTFTATTGDKVFGAIISGPIGDPINRDSAYLPTGNSNVRNPGSDISVQGNLLLPGESSTSSPPGFSVDRIHAFVYNDVNDEFAILYKNATLNELVFTRWRRGRVKPFPEVVVANSGLATGLYVADMAFNGRQYLVVYGQSSGNVETVGYLLLSASGNIEGSGVVDPGIGFSESVLGHNSANQIPGQGYGAYVNTSVVKKTVRNVQVRWNNRLNRWVVSASYLHYRDAPNLFGQTPLDNFFFLQNTHVTAVSSNTITLSTNTDINYLQVGCKLGVVSASGVLAGVYGIVSWTTGANPVVTLDTDALTPQGVPLTNTVVFPDGSYFVFPREDVVCWTLGYDVPTIQFQDADECSLENVDISGLVDIEERYINMASPLWQAGGPPVGSPASLNTTTGTNQFTLYGVSTVQRAANYNHLFLRPDARARMPSYSNVRSSAKIRYGYGLISSNPQNIVAAVKLGRYRNG